MIFITQLDELELRLTNFDTNTSKFRKDKKIFSLFIDLYETNFEKYMEHIGEIDFYHHVNQNVRFHDYQNPDKIRLLEFYKDYDVVRPYFYTYKDKYYFFHSTLRAYHGAIIYELEPNEILQKFENDINDFNLFEKRKRKNCEIMFITKLETSQ